MVKTDKEANYSVYSEKDYEPQEKVLEVFYDPSTTYQTNRDKHSIELTPKIHLMHPVGKYINHSCYPTMFFDKADGAFYASIYIFKGEELTFNYLNNESEISSPFKCNCNTSSCAKLID